MRWGLRGERLLALFILGWFAFHPPILTLFAARATVLGWPVLYLYMFVVWAVVIALIALITSRDDGAHASERPGDSRPGAEREG